MLLFIFGGKKNEEEISPLFQYYENKIGRIKNYEVQYISSKETAFEKIKQDESKKILSTLKPNDCIILFDQIGKEITSEEYAKLLNTSFEAKRTVIIVGGSYGVTDEVKNKATHTIAFSKMIFPHQLARVIVVEQTYRALSILEGSKYHHP